MRKNDSEDLVSDHGDSGEVLEHHGGIKRCSSLKGAAAIGPERRLAHKLDQRSILEHALNQD